MDEISLVITVREDRKDIHEAVVKRLLALAEELTKEYADEPVHFTATVFE